MFGKLLKHEFRNTWRLIALFGVVAVGLAFVVMLLGRLYVGMIRGSSNTVDEWKDLLGVVTGSFVGIYGLFMVAANVIVFLFLALRFYREIYSDTGYLMHSLPVTKGQLLGAHLLCASIWMIAFVLLDTLCVMIAAGAIPEFYANFSRAWNTFWEGLARLSKEYPEITRYINVGGIMMILSVIITPFYEMMKAYLAVSLGQLFKTHRVVGAIIMYFIIAAAIGVVTQTLGYFQIQDIIEVERYTYGLNESRRYIEDFMRQMNIAVALRLVINILLGIIFFFVTRYRMTNHLDLE